MDKLLEGEAPPLSELKIAGSPHPGLCKVLKLFSSTDKAFIVHTYSKHSLLSVARFHAATTLSSGTLGNTTGLGCKDLRLRFIIYQLFHAVCFIHQAGLCLDTLLPCNVLLDDDMWLSLSVGMSNRVLAALDGQKPSAFSEGLAVPRPIGYYEPLTIQWISGKISNLEYLMAINYGAGRTVIDPLYHPLIPWVTDFTVNCLDSPDARSFRDLHMTKFRLSKGDTQLETTYRHSDPPHHVPESLSELTYYIYMARRTPLHILRRVVRDVFVPEHYPQSMHRIFEWTPDECIPEFFLDPTVFQSNHLKIGLGDLELPTFAPTPHEFVAYHRAVLESDWVSAQLHHWIDLTFGYCLDGAAAVQNMNVPLRHTLTSSERMGLDTPNVNKNPGFVMLFQRPHPHKQLANIKAKSHLFSYNNTRECTMSFDEMNPVYFLDNSSKYTLQANQLGKDKDHFDFQSYIEGDQPSSGHHRNGSHTRAPVNVSPVQREGMAQVMYEDANRASVPKRNKKSLSKPTADQSLAKLKAANPIAIAFDDIRCKASVSNMVDQEHHYSFTTQVAAALEGVYELPPRTEDGKKVKLTGWDDEFARAAASLPAFVSSRRTGPLTELESYQAADMFAVGCMVAELYMGRPLLSRNDAILISNSTDPREAMDIVYRASAGLPLVIRRLVSLLIHPDPGSRPAAMEILKTCFIRADSDDVVQRSETPYERGLINPLRHSAFTEAVYRIPTVENRLDYSQAHISFMRLEVLSDFCSDVFPSYFRGVYSLVGAIKMAPTHLIRLYVLIKNINQMQNFPLEGLHLALFHVLDVIGDSSSFGDKPNASESEKTMETFVLSNYWRVMDVIGLRLGIEGTEKLLVPQLLKFLNNFRSSECLQELLRSSLWTVVAHRAGVKCFLRSFLPQLLTFVSAGTLYSVFTREKGVKKNENVPLWAASESLDRTDWLRGSCPESIHKVQVAAVYALKELTEPYSLGGGLAARYLLPSLLSLVGVPQLAMSGFENNDDVAVVSNAVADKLFDDVVAATIAARKPLSDDDRPSFDEIVALAPENPSNEPSDKEILEKYVMSKATFRAQDMHVIRAVVDIGTRLGDLVISELILATIFNVTIVDLEAQLTVATVKPGVAAALMEVILVLTGLLPTLPTSVVQHDVLQPSRISEFCLPRLLSSWPLTATYSFLDDIPENIMETSTLERCVETVRLQTVLTELCRLIVSASMIGGAEVCGDYVLPHVDTFFKNFVAAFGMIPVESRTMMKAFELGAALYVPLVQLMGPEAFYTAVPNVNPRLDMWLSSIGSHVPLKSPPLPSNIWPEVTSEVTNQPEKKKSIMQWISGRSKWMSSLTASNATPTSSSTFTTMPNIIPTAVVVNHSRSASVTYPSAASFSSPTPSARHSMPHQLDDLPAGQVISVANAAGTAKTPRKDVEKPAPADSALKTPHRIAKLLHRTPTSHVKANYNTPTEGTELVEFDTEDDDIVRLGHAVPATPGGDDRESHDMSVLVSEVKLEPVEEAPRDEESDTEQVLKRTGSRLTEVDDSDDDDLDDYTESIKHRSDRSDNARSVLLDDVDENLPQAVATETIAVSAVAALVPDSVGDGEVKKLGLNGDESYEDEDAFRHTVDDNDNPYSHYQRLIQLRSRGVRAQQSTPNKQKKANKRASSKMSMLYASETQESAEEAEVREQRCAEMTWLLAGNGRWNVEKEVKDKSNKEQNKLLKGNKGQVYYTNGYEWNPAAQMSMTTPKIAVDVASDASAWINFQYQSQTQFKLEDTPGLIRCMVANPSESLLMTCSRTGVRLWSLTSHPLLHISSYTRHSMPPFQAAFLRDGQHAITCDGTVHLWDIESRHRLDLITPSHITNSSVDSKTNMFTSMSVVSSKFGINPSLGDIGDEQLITTMQDGMYFYDVRCNHQTHHSLLPVAHWTLPQIPPPQGNFITSSVEPLQLTCAASHEHYAYAGSSSGGLWVLDRRMGRVLQSWQAHDGPILKVCTPPPPPAHCIASYR